MMPNNISGKLLYKNLLTLKSISDVARSFPHIHFVLIKGAALATIDTDGKIFLRPMEDVDVVLGDENSYHTLLRQIEKEPSWRKIPGDPNSFAKYNYSSNDSKVLTVVDFHKNFWYTPSARLSADIIERAVRIDDEVYYPPNLLRLSPEDLWIDIAVHATFHHTLRTGDRMADIEFLESVFPINKEVVANRLATYFGVAVCDAILEVFDKKRSCPRRKVYFLSRIANKFCKKFLKADFPQKGFVARIFLVRRGLVGGMRYIIRDMIFPPSEFLSRRYDMRSHSRVNIALYRMLRPLFLVGKSLTALTLSVIQNLTIFKR